MESAAAVGLASNIIGLIEVARDITSTAKEIHKSVTGLTKAVEEFEISAKNVRRILDLIISPESASTPDEELQTYAKDFRIRVDEFLIEVDALKADNSKRWYQSLKNAIKAWLKKDELEGSARKIRQMGNQVTMHIVTVYIPKMDAKLDGIYNQQKEIRSYLSQEMGNLMELVKDVHRKHKEDGILLQAIQKWFQDQEALEVQRGCLQALYFSKLHERKDGVRWAHKKTFRWIFEDRKDPDEESRHNSRFRTWLHTEEPSENVFWITGKPGAGKSTLMKFLSRHECLKENLQAWTGHRNLIIAEYFFWRPGTYMQNSIKGLLQSLLFQVLRERRDIIALVFPNQDWTLVGEKFEFSMDELRRGLRRVTELAFELDFRLFFFIDGLDEFSEDQEIGYTTNSRDLLDILDTFHDLAAVKLCISSRKWTEFEQKFGGEGRAERHFSVNDFTRGDIRKYTEEKLGKNPMFQRLTMEDDGYLTLVNDIIKNAEGVFLWVHLAVCSLLDGITYSDRITDLQERLNHLPKELEDLYVHILNTIPKQYRKSVARFLLMVNEYWQGDRWSDIALLIAHSCLHDDERAEIMKAKTLDEEWFHKQLITTKDRINAHCKGLLEVCIMPFNPGFKGCCRERLKMILRPRVFFAHRSIAEFLKIKRIENNLLLVARLPSDMCDFRFRIRLAVLHLCICFFNAAKDFSISERVLGGEGHFDWLFRTTKNAKSLSDWVDILQIVSQPLGRSGLIALNKFLEWSEPIRYPGLTLGVQFGSYELCKRELDLDSAAIKEYWSLFIGYRDFEDSQWWKMLKLFLQRGADPNEHCREEALSVWVFWLMNSFPKRLRWPLEEWRDVTSMFLHQGADPGAIVDLYIDERKCGGRLFSRTQSGSKFSFTAADLVRFALKDMENDIEKLLPPKSDDRETPEQVFARLKWDEDESKRCPICGLY